MSDSDPHIHVEQKVLQAGADFRNVVALTLGLVMDEPGIVTTGCDIQVPYAMTSPHPDSVTCLACREHAHREHLRFADQVEHLSKGPVAPISQEDAAKAVQRHRDLAKRFSS